MAMAPFVFNVKHTRAFWMLWALKENHNKIVCVNPHQFPKTLNAGDGNLSAVHQPHFH